MSLPQKFFAVFVLTLFLSPIFSHGQKAKEEALKFEPKMLDIPAPLVSQPLPLFFETKKLEPGEYVLEISVMDKIGKKEGLGKINFIIK